jgi:hypothetical protein
VDRNDPLCDIIAKKIIEIGVTTGSNTNAVAITELGVRHLGM